MGLSSRNGSRHKFNGSDQDLVGWAEDEKTQQNYIRNKLQKTYPEAFTAIKDFNGWDATTVDSNLHQIGQAPKISAFPPSERLLDSMKSCV